MFFVVFFFFSFFFNLISADSLTSYEVYQTNNNYPRPVLLSDNSVLATSGKTPGYFVKYNQNAEVIIPSKEMFPYASNAAIKQLKGTDNRYVIVSGKGENFNITIFDDNINTITTTTDHDTDSYKIDLLPLADGSINIGWTMGSVLNRGGTVYIAKYTLNADSTFTQQKIQSWSTDNYYISCVEMDNNDLVCQYITYKCRENYKTFDKNYNNVQTQEIWESNQCGFDKVIKLDGDYVAFSFLMDGVLKVRVYYHYPSTNTLEPKQVHDTMSSCEINTLKVDISTFSGNKFIGTCIRNYTTNVPSAQIAIGEYFPSNNSFYSYTIQSSATYVDYPFASKFGDDFISIFYHINGDGGDNVFEILEMPNCQGFSLEMFAGQNSNIFTMTKGTYVIKGSGDTTDILNVIFPELPIAGVVYFQANDTEVESNKVYAIPSLYYTAPSVEGTYTLKFAGVNHDMKLGKWCSVTFTVHACYSGCKTCNEYGTADDNKCLNGCLTDEGYYPIIGLTNSCAKDLDKYYVDSTQGGWMPCHDNCASCSKGATTDKENCDTCVGGKYKIEDDDTGKCTDTRPDGYYFDSTLNKYMKCYTTCSSCSSLGTSSNNLCTSCKANNYEFEDITGKCDSSDTSSTSNYYLDTSLTPYKWMKCYSTCATCSTGGSISTHNCDTCISGYKIKEGTKDCLNSLPLYYYETDTMYKKCDPSCETCFGDPLTSPSQSTNCITCRTDEGYYPYDTTDTAKNCVNSIPSGYYLDSSTSPNCYKKCNEACLECNGPSDSTTTNCKDKQCAGNYYAVSTLLSNCLKDPPQYYFLDTLENPNLYKKCYDECLTCSGVGDSSDFKCIACKENGYKIENTNNCYYSTPTYYFLDTDNLYKKCYDSCLECNGVGDSTNHKCLTCKDSSYKKIYNTNNCVTSLPQYYYESGNEYRPCYSTCATCSGDGSSTNNECNSCRDSNILIDGTQNCVSQAPDHFYYDSLSNTYKECDISCKSCSDSADNCIQCDYDNNYYPKEGTSTPCYNTKPDTNYYLDSNNKEYRECYSTCATCSQGGDATDNHCDTCDNSYYYPMYDKQNNCAHQPEFYYLDSTDNCYKRCYITCASCSEGGNDSEHKCTTCIGGALETIQTDGTKRCVTDCKDNKKLYNNDCYYCPEGTAVQGDSCVNCLSINQVKLEDPNFICDVTSCPDNLCAPSAQDGYFLYDDTLNYYKKCDSNCKTCFGTRTSCTSCNLDTDYKILYNNQCLDSCPVEGGKQLYKLPDNTCVEECPDIYIVDEINHECLSCYPDYKNKGDNTNCYTFNQLPIGYKIIDTTNNIFDMCYSTCKECSEISTNENEQKCTSCIDGNYLQILPLTNCVSDCGDFLVSQNSTWTCINCKTLSTPAFKDKNDNTKCYSAQPSNSIIVDQDTNTFETCYPTCATCLAISTDQSNQQCLTCDSTHYLEYAKTNCLGSCTDDYYQDEDNHKCINCAARGQYKFKDTNECTSNKSGGYEINNETGTLGRCFSTCETCNGEGNESNHNCISCKSGFYLQEDEVTCKDECPDYLVIGSNNKCVTCKISETEGFKFPNEDYCRPSIPDGAYLINSTYNIISFCYNTCKTCSAVGDADNHLCESCQSAYNMQFGTHNCKPGCESNYAAENNECISCESKGESHIQGELSCTNSIEHTYPIDSDTNTYGRCFERCDTCSMGGDENNQNCDSCLAPYYKESESSKQCSSTCDSKLVADDATRTCINCKTYDENKEQYLNPNSGQCEDTIPDGYYVNDEDYNTLAQCHSNCATCSTGPNGYAQQNCDTCKEDMYKQYGTNNCDSTCSSNIYAKDDSNPSDKKCILCTSLGKVKYENEDHCIERPPNTYLSDKINGIIKDCDSTCSSCSSDEKCDTCKEGFIFNPKDNTKCVQQCHDLWYIDDSNVYKCVNESSCDSVTDRTYIIENTKQCVNSCSSSDCIGCSNLYEHQNKCVSSCPSGFQINAVTKKCDVEQEEDDSTCKVIFTTSYKNNITEIPSLALQRTNSYINKYSSSSMNNVDIIKTVSFTFHLFKSDECEYETSNNYSLSYINFTECKLKIVAANSSIAMSDILFIKVDLNQTGDTNQVVYDAYNIITGNFIDLSICEDIVINYPLTNKVRLSSAEKMLLQGIDVYNSSDPFFNDFCYPFYSEDGKDVLMKDRRSDYYIENSLCEDGCNYTKINFKSGMVECDCEHQSNKGLDTVNSILEKIPIDGFGDSLSTSNLIVVRCYKLVFNFKYMKKNIGCWIMILLFFFQIPPMITFLISGMRSLYSYLNHVSNKKQLEQMKENEEQEEEEEEEENDGSSMPSNPPKKTTKDSINDDEYGTPAKLMEKVSPSKKLTMLDLNQKNNYIDKYSDSTKKMMNTEYMHVQKTSMNSDFTDNNNVNDGSENENSKEDDYEQDDYDEIVYENAIQYDNRSICKFLLHAMSMKIVFLAPCSNISIYEPFCVKIVAFFLNIATYLVMNAILFDESYIEKRYNETGNTGFIYMIKNEIPKCIYASLASTVIGFLIMYLTSAKKRFKVAIETQKDPAEFIKRTKKIISQLKCKIIGFFITSIILMGLFWYYISAFCAVYQKTQVPWLEGCLITFVFCVIFQIIYALFITLFRYMGLKCKISCCYTLSTYLL